MFVRRSLFSAFALLLLTSPAFSGSIPIPNYSFESPTVADVSPYASANIDVWQKSPPPAYWTQLGYTSDQWYNSAGEFYNVPSPYIDNADGNQVGFMFSNPGLELSQQLSNTFQVGSPYQLTVGIEGGGYGMSPGYPMQIGLYYLNGGNQVMVGTTTVLNTNTGPITHLTDYSVTIPAVAASDPWAGQSFGIALIQTGGTGTGGYWDIDNVRLATVPEPSSMALLAAGLSMLVLGRRWLLGKQTTAAHE